MTDHESRVASGIAGLDTLLHGGFVPDRTYMVRGRSGAGKSIVGYHFLAEASYPVLAPSEGEGDT